MHRHFAGRAFAGAHHHVSRAQCDTACAHFLYREAPRGGSIRHYSELQPDERSGYSANVDSRACAKPRPPMGLPISTENSRAGNHARVGNALDLPSHPSARYRAGHGLWDEAPAEWSSMRPGGPTDADQGEPAAAALAPTRAETAIRLLRATKAVDSPTWKLPLGDRTASSGRAAPKKTTAIRMITSILQPHSGSISVLGHACALAAKDRSGYRPEERGLYRK